MKITLDTDANTIIVPDNYFDKIDEMNTLLEKNKAQKVDYIEYIKKEFEAAIVRPLKRKKDVVVPRGSRAPKVSK